MPLPMCAASVAAAHAQTSHECRQNGKTMWRLPAKQRLCCLPAPPNDARVRTHRQQQASCRHRRFVRHMQSPCAENQTSPATAAVPCCRDASGCHAQTCMLQHREAHSRLLLTTLPANMHCCCQRGMEIARGGVCVEGSRKQRQAALLACLCGALRRRQLRTGWGLNNCETAAPNYLVLACV
jgi:hypothetical protein